MFGRDGYIGNFDSKALPIAKTFGVTQEENIYWKKRTALKRTLRNTKIAERIGCH